MLAGEVRHQLGLEVACAAVVACGYEAEALEAERILLALADGYEITGHDLGQLERHALNITLDNWSGTR
jgi:hypothetical protein